jgi:hypothetical protein
MLHAVGRFDSGMSMRTRLFVLLAVLSVPLLGGVAHAATAATVTVNAGATQGVSKATLSTQLIYHGILEQTPNGLANLKALHEPLIRIHAGTDAVYSGYGPELPEGVKQGSWSFAELNSMVNDVDAAGTTPILNVRYAPDWMWTCRTPFDGGSAGQGGLRDRTYKTFASYMARLVSYYNRGKMTTESGAVITNPAGTTRRIPYWELWNEPDLANEDPCHTANWDPPFTPSSYVQMWNVVAPAMRAVDSTIKLIGPTVANPDEQGYAPGDDYLGALATTGLPRPSVLSFHAYGYWDNTATDKVIWDGDGAGCCGGIPELAFGLKDLHARFPAVPVYVTEDNVNADWGDDPSARPWTAFGAAWGASYFRALVLGGAALAHQYAFVNSLQFGLVNPSTGAKLLPWWRDQLLVRAFPAGSTIVSATSSVSGIEALAVKRPNGTLAVLVIDRQVNGSTTKGGPGVAATVTVKGLSGSLTVRQIDKTTSAATGPVARTLGAVGSTTLTFPGYGMAVIEAG